MPSPTTDDQLRLLRHPWRAARRRVLLHRRGLAALLLAGAVVAGLGAVRAPAASTTGVWVAARDLGGGQVLGPGDLHRARLPRDAVPSRTVGYDALAGRRLAGPMRAGEPFTDRRVLGADLLSAYPGRVAVPVHLADAAVVSLLRAGDRVDLVRLDPQGDDPADLLAPEAAVLAVLPADAGGLDAATGAAQGDGGLLVVAVDGDTAPEVAAAGAAGFLSLTLPG